MAFKDYSEFAKPELALPYKGKFYTIGTPDVELGLRLTRGLDGKTEELGTDDIEMQWRLVLGSAYDEMLADKVPVDLVARAFVTALADFQMGREMAEATWEVGTDPEGIRAWYSAKYPDQAPETSEESTDMAEEISTP